MRKSRILALVGTMLASIAVILWPPGETASAAPAADPTTLGTTAATAAGSCWEIKQLNQAATDGDYWLLTPMMYEPQQFYCDMTTDGGGWVLVGKGRDGWRKNNVAVGAPSGLLTPDLAAMSSATYQYSGETIDALLNGARVDGLPDGVRLRRALDTAGTSWQEVRMRFSAKFNHWAWAFGALYPLKNWSFNSASGTGGTSQNFGSDQAFNRVNMVPTSATGYRQGFAFGTSVAGSNAATSYVWSSGGGSAIPYTQVFVRPQVTSSDAGFKAIADSGTPGHSEPSVASSDAIPATWGVTGTAGATNVEGDVEVQAFTQSGDNMYVGGNFKYVQQDASGTGQVLQPFLAAFNVNTGQWVSSFRPQLNEQVMALATLPNGDVVAAGQFSQANGQPATAVVALNPSTGATDPNWNLSIENLRSGEVVRIHSLKVFDNQLYLAGSFTHLAGGSRPNSYYYASNLGRVSVADGTPDAGWNGDLNGTVNAISGGSASDGDRMYAAGFFTSHGTTQGATPTTTQNAAAIETADGAPLASPAWNPTWSNSNSYQRSIDAVGDKVWVGGSEHSLFQFDRSSFNRVLGDIMYDKGDIQTISDSNGAVYAGCHCNYYDYANAYAWPTLTPDWTRADGMVYFGAWDASTGNRITQFAPQVDSRTGTGVWALATDSTGTLWVGGDLTIAATSTKPAAWAGSFARFRRNDSTAPSTPQNLHVVSQTSSTVTLGWNGVSDPSGVHYQILRDDRPIASVSGTSVTVPKSTSGRFFVRAADGAGNVSASSQVLVVGTGNIPPNASFTWSANHSTLSVDASSSTSSDGTITDYLWDFGDGSGAHGATYQHTYSAAGSYLVTLTVTDGAGATASATQSVTVGAPPVNGSPSDLYGKQIYQDNPWVYYRLGESNKAKTAQDSGPDGRNGSYVGSFVYGVAGALKNSTDTAISTNGSQSFVVSPAVASPPTTFSTEIWFKTTSKSGGRLIGYASSSTGNSSNYDRHIYMQNTGQLVFGVWTGQENEVISPSRYNDGLWHMAVATMSPVDGMKLYVDGALVGSNANQNAENFNGYWKVGSDNVWEGASTGSLTGSLDEAAVFDHVLTPAQIQAEYTDGATAIGPSPNNPPTASFTASMSYLAGHFDAGASTDPDGTIQSYAWDFGDGTTQRGQIVDHAYAAPGTYTVTLTVTDDGGAEDTITQDVTATSAPVDTVVVSNDSTWSWRYIAGDPPATWNTAGFDASSWNTGKAPLGFGSSSIVTNIDTFSSTSSRPVAAYFTKSFSVADTSKVVKLQLAAVADDGVVVYVNGTEVNRTNMPLGTVTSATYASSAVSTSNAQSVTITVPKNLLVNGANVVSAETHLNYKGTSDASFQLKATLTTNADGDTDKAPLAAFTSSMNQLHGTFDASGSSDPDGSIQSYSWNFGDGSTGSGVAADHTYSQAGSYNVTLSVMDDDGTVTSLTKQVDATSPDTVVVPKGSIWSWKYDSSALPANWDTPAFDSSVWKSGAGTLGFGNSSVVTNIDSYADQSTRPVAAYFTHAFQVSNASAVTKLVLSTVADDGIVVYVNGQEVNRTNMPAGAVTSSTYASSAVSTANASKVSINVPTNLLVDGTNVISAETHLNYRKTPDATFDLSATVTQ